MTTGLDTQTAFSRTLQVWDENTCRCCRAILSAVEKDEGGACEWCRWKADHDYYVENLRMYGGE